MQTLSYMHHGLHVAPSSDSGECAALAEALAAIGPSNSENWVVVRTGLPLLQKMELSQSTAEREAAVRSSSLFEHYSVGMLEHESSFTCESHIIAQSCMVWCMENDHISSICGMDSTKLQIHASYAHV